MSVGFRNLFFRNHCCLSCRRQRMDRALRESSVCSHPLKFSKCIGIARRCAGQHDHCEGCRLRWSYSIVIGNKLKCDSAPTVSKCRVNFSHESFVRWWIEMVQEVCE